MATGIVIDIIVIAPTLVVVAGKLITVAVVPNSKTMAMRVRCGNGAVISSALVVEDAVDNRR